MKKTTDTLYFWDGVRKIDMVLAYEDTHTEEDKTLKRKELLIMTLFWLL